MRYYFAPMEGVTGYVYRRNHFKFFPGVDKYFSPFLCPGQKKLMTPKELKDICPENNEGYTLIPQILTNRAEDFIKLVKELSYYGYEEINLNLGCPSGTVVSKKKGSGFLEFPRELNQFLEEVFSKTDMKISIKTRIGKEDPEEFEQLLEIYNQYPLEELIIHPRVQTDYYKNVPNLEVFSYALEKSKAPVCYNGDLFTQEEYQTFTEKFPEVECVMFGRGLVANPSMIKAIIEGMILDRKVLKEFHDSLCMDYQEIMSGERNVLFKMKEIWFYMGKLFPDGKKYLKKIKKAQYLIEYQAAVNSLLREIPMETQNIEF